MRRIITFIFVITGSVLFYSQTCFGLIQNQLEKIKISKSKKILLEQMIESSFYKVKAKITYKEADANIVEFSGVVASHTGKINSGNIVFKLLHPKGINFQYDITIKNGKFYEEFFTEQKFLPGVYLWKATITLDEEAFTNELFFLMEIKGAKKSIVNNCDAKENNSICDVEYIFRLPQKQNEDLIISLKNFELKTRGLYYFIYILHKLIELTNETIYLVRLAQKDKSRSLGTYINTSYREFQKLMKKLNHYNDKNLWDVIDNTMPMRLLFLKKYYKKVYESFKKTNVDMEYIGKTFEISTIIIEMLSKILW